jgi:acyl carrier protein
MAKTSDVSDKIIQALADYLKRDAASIQTTHHLRDDLGLDSMAVIEMLYRIEEVFNLQIPDQDLVGLTTVGQVIAYVQGRVAPPKDPRRQPGTTPAKAAAKKPAAKPSTKSKKA